MKITTVSDSKSYTIIVESKMDVIHHNNGFKRHLRIETVGKNKEEAIKYFESNLEVLKDTLEALNIREV